MKRVILNLDWGSFYLKGCARLQGRPGTGLPYQLLGLLDGKQVLAQQTIQLPGNLSLKAGFLTGKLQPTDLANYRSEAVKLLASQFVTPLLGNLRAWTEEPLNFCINIHTPLQLTDQAMVLGSGVFAVFDPAERLVMLTYRTIEEWRSRLDHPAQPVENRWAHWLAGCLGEALQKEGFDQEVASFCFLPESLTCVQDVVGPLGSNESRQVLLLDVGHFTTDFALVAFHQNLTERMIVRRADSIFDAGYQFIEQHGPQSWTQKVMGILKTFARADHATQGMHGYLDLAVVLVGGGAAGLQPASRETLRGEVQEWALRHEYFREALQAGLRKVFLASPPHLIGAFQVLGQGDTTQQLEAVSTELHVPCVLACGLADARMGLRVTGETLLPALLKDWERRKLPAPPAVVLVRKGKSVEQEPKPLLLQECKTGTELNKTKTPPISPENRALHYFQMATASDDRGLHRLDINERKAYLVQASMLGYQPAILSLAKLRIKSGNSQEEHMGHLSLNELAHKGNLEALFQLGKMHVQRLFRHLPANPGKGFFLLLRAAKECHQPSMVLVADCFEKGLGTSISAKSAALWRSRAAQAVGEKSHGKELT